MTIFGEKHSIARRFSFILLITAFVIGAIVILIDALDSYNTALKRMNLQVEQIKESYLDNLVKSVWMFDYKELQNQIAAIKRFTYIVRVEVIDEEQKYFSAGDMPGYRTNIESMDLIYEYKQKKRKIGELVLYIDIKLLMSEVRQQVLPDLIFHFLLAMIIGLSGTVLFRHLVARPLHLLEQDLKNDNPGKFDSPIKLKRKSNRFDELAYLEQTLNNMRADLKKYINDKNLFIREVHHRIKNNLQTIKSILNIQAQNAEGTAAAQVLIDADNRLESMLLLYNKLYESPDTSSLSAEEYLNSLVDEILEANDHEHKVRKEYMLDDLVFSPKTLSLLGIIVNELISNSLKHAFHDRDNCVISLSLHDYGESATVSGVNKARLLYKDNGTGFDEKEKPAEGLGMLLIENLAIQLNGDYEMSGTDGFKFELVFSY